MAVDRRADVPSPASELDESGCGDRVLYAVVPLHVEDHLRGAAGTEVGNGVLLFTRVTPPPATQSTTAFWHFGWPVTDVHKGIEVFQQRGITLLPLYIEEGGGTVEGPNREAIELIEIKR